MNPSHRLALRHEGAYWVAYYARPDSMEDAVEIGRIALLAIRNKNRQQAFTRLMLDVIGDLIEEQTGARPEWEPRLMTKAEKGELEH